MLFNHRKLRDELREHGRTASALVLGIHTYGEHDSMRAMWADDSDLTTGYTMVRMHLKVMPAGEAPFEKSLNTRLQTFVYTGDTIEVLYDPNDHDKVYFDYEANAKQTMDALARPGTSRATQPGSGSEAELMSRLEELLARHERGEISDEQLKADTDRMQAESPGS